MDYRERQDREREEEEEAAAGNPLSPLASRARLWASGAAVVLVVLLTGWEVAITLSAVPCTVVSRTCEMGGCQMVAECEGGQRDGWNLSREAPDVGRLVHWSPLATWGTRRTLWLGPAMWSFWSFCAAAAFVDERNRHDRSSRNARPAE